MIDKWDVCRDDRVIINGGEPTVHPQLIEILGAIAETKAEIAVYSNGRKFSNMEFAQAIMKIPNTRITIPVFGGEHIHEGITNIKGSFVETIEGINNLTELKNNQRIDNGIEIKFIIGKEYVDKWQKSMGIVDKYLKFPKNVDTLIFAGFLQPKNSKVDMNGESHIDIAHHIDDEIDQIIDNNIYGLNVKILDIPFCNHKRAFQDRLLSIYDESLFIEKDKFIYYDENVKGRTRKYNKRPDEKVECSICSYTSICSNSIDRYGALQYDKSGYWFFGLE
jgi:MoaA/NifB/PqqE/SkfB family radical SAM enzyme